MHFRNKLCVVCSCRQVFNNCVADGVNLFDTAEVYGFGRSEYLCGKFRRDYKGAEKDGIVVGGFFFPHVYSGCNACFR